MTSPPTGRIKKPAPNVAKLLNSEIVGLIDGKNVRPIEIAKKP
jgi:hypothetical protein